MKHLVALLLLFSSAVAQAPPATQHRAIVSAWNECVVSADQDNAYWLELQKSLQLNPPWRVVDARAPARRAELIEKIIVEHKRRIQLLEKIRTAEK